MPKIQIKRSKRIRIVKQNKKKKTNKGPKKPGLAPRAYITDSVHRDPVMQSKGPGTLNVKHRELFYQYKTATANLDSYEMRCNPGLSSMFPWLSAVATRFETYQFVSLCFRYQPRLATTTQGIVGCYFDFDVSDPRASSMVEMGMQHSNRSTSTWNTLEVHIDLKRAPPLWRFTRAGVGEEEHWDEKMYDIGKLVLYSDMTGLAANTVTGYWEVEYEVMLKTPQYEDPVSGRWVSVAVDGTVGAVDLFTAGLTACGHSNRPFHVSGPIALTFDEPYQGLLSVSVTSPSTNQSPAVAWAGTVGGAITSVYSCWQTNTRGINNIAVKLLAGDTLTFGNIMSDLSGFTVCLAKAAYDSLI